MHNVPLLTAPLLTKHGFRHGFSTRQGGVSRAPFDSLNLAPSVGDEPDHVAENQRRFAAAIGYEAEGLFTLSQVHGRAVRVLTGSDAPDRVRVEQGDALVAPPRLAVAVRTADCVPVLIVDPEARYVAAVHAGWRGVLAEVVPAAVEALRQASGAPAERLFAAVFPHIRRCCFEVDAALGLQLAAANRGSEQCLFDPSSPRRGALPVQQPRAAGSVVPPQQIAAAASGAAQPQQPTAASGDVLPLTAAGPGAAVDRAQPLTAAKAFVALDVIVRAQLEAQGVLAGSIDDVPGCTVCEPERFFSYRRDGARSGRHLTAVLG